MFPKICFSSAAPVQISPAEQVYTQALLPYSAPPLYFAPQHSRNHSVLGDEYLCIAHLLLHLAGRRQQL